MTLSTSELMPLRPDASTPLPTARAPLRTYRVNLMRAGYLLMAVGLAGTRWPLLADAASLPAYEGGTGPAATSVKGAPSRPGAILRGTLTTMNRFDRRAAVGVTPT